MRMCGARTGSLRKSTRPSATITTAEAAKTARQDATRGDEARDRARAHDADHQPARDGADDASARRVGREMRRERDEDLHRDRAEADGAGAGEKGRPRGREGGGRERDRAERDADEHEPPVLDEIGERHDEKEPSAVADLRHGHDETGGLRREPERLGDRLDQRLRVIDVGGEEAAGGGEQQDRRRRDLRLARDGWRLVQPIHQ